MDTPITLDQLNEALDQLIAERGDEVNPTVASGCFYTRQDGTPACIVGNILPLLGLDQHRPGAFDANNIGTTVDTLIPDALTPDALFLAGWVQEFADDGNPWHCAVEKARGAQQADQ